jgi:hypothetical protein
MQEDDRREGAITLRAGQISQQGCALRLRNNFSLFSSLAYSKRAELYGRAFEVNPFVGISRVSSERDAEKSDEAQKKSRGFH